MRTARLLSSASVAALVWLACASAPAPALVVRGDHRWRGIDVCPPDWSAAGLDDRGWGAVAAPWIFVWPPDEASGVSDARPFWSLSERGESCVRRHFTLDRVPARGAVLKVWVDDDYQLYLNGALVGVSDNHWAQWPGETYDVTSFLRAGDNVVALKLIDLGTARAALFRLEVPDAAEEPVGAGELWAAAEPSLLFLAVVAAIGATVCGLAALARRVGKLAARLPAELGVILTLAVLAACQRYLHETQFYSTTRHPGLPWAEWNWALIFPAILLLFAVAAAARQRDTGDLDAAPRGERWLLLAVLLLATALRTIWLDSLPIGFFQDEAINGNDALALFDGRGPQVWSESVGGRPTLFFYLLGAAISVAGRNYLALKIVPVLFGVGSVWALYRVGRLALGPYPALWGAFLLAVSWQHVTFSRMAWEVNCVPFFAAAGFALWLHGLRPGRSASFWPLVLGTVVLATGLYTYAAYRAVPAGAVVFLGLVALSPDRTLLRGRIAALCTGAVLSLVALAPLILFAWQNPVLYWSRYTYVSLTKYMSYFGTPIPWLHQTGKSLLAYNQQGDWVSQTTYLDWATGALFLFGILSPVPVSRRVGQRLLWAWFGTFVLLSSLTRDAPHLTRSLGALPPALLFAGYGAHRLVECVRGAARLRFLAPALAAALALWAGGLNVYEYFFVAPNQPQVDARMNARARELCEMWRRAVPADLYLTYDLDYWTSAQCFYLVPPSSAKRHVITTPQVLSETVAALQATPRPALLAIGGEFIDRYRADLPLDANGEPKVNLPVRPRLFADRQARPTYYLFRLPPSG